MQIQTHEDEYYVEYDRDELTTLVEAVQTGENTGEALGILDAGIMALDADEEILDRLEDEGELLIDEDEGELLTDE